MAMSLAEQREFAALKERVLKLEVARETGIARVYTEAEHEQMTAARGITIEAPAQRPGKGKGAR